ncbi:MAG: hypothetical protein QMD04_05075 [Anaerolineales bacterium]|nr:hypothetical protein [Anaerolineales bacterium]
MTGTDQPTCTYDVAPQVKPFLTSRIYAGLWETIGRQNASAPLIFPETGLRDDRGNGVVSTGWHMFWPMPQAFYARPQISRPQPRKISLHEAQRVAIEALLSAEKRRQENREREAVFWAAMEDE